jgi:hypothetical protein
MYRQKKHDLWVLQNYSLLKAIHDMHKWILWIHGVLYAPVNTIKLDSKANVKG